MGTEKVVRAEVGNGLARRGVGKKYLSWRELEGTKPEGGFSRTFMSW